MKTTWIVSAHRSGARLYEHKMPFVLTLRREIPHPEGHKKNSDFNTDRPGRSFGGIDARRSVFRTDYEPTRDAAEAFARSIAAMLAHELDGHRYEQLILVAEPRFLGLLRKALDARVEAIVIGSVAREFSRPADTELKEHLRDLIYV